jgi:hypothetical protein
MIEAPWGEPGTTPAPLPVLNCKLRTNQSDNPNLSYRQAGRIYRQYGRLGTSTRLPSHGSLLKPPHPARAPGPPCCGWPVRPYVGRDRAGRLNLPPLRRLANLRSPFPMSIHSHAIGVVADGIGRSATVYSISGNPAPGRGCIPGLIAFVALPMIGICLLLSFCSNTELFTSSVSCVGNATPAPTPVVQHVPADWAPRAELVRLPK